MNQKERVMFPRPEVKYPGMMGLTDYATIANRTGGRIEALTKFAFQDGSKQFAVSISYPDESVIHSSVCKDISYNTSISIPDGQHIDLSGAAVVVRPDAAIFVLPTEKSRIVRTVELSKGKIIRGRYVLSADGVNRLGEDVMEAVKLADEEEARNERMLAQIIHSAEASRKI